MINVLLVEDNELNRDMLSRRLARCGFGIISASDGKEGVELARREQPDIILMDLSLPLMDGWEALRHLKSDPQTRLIPVVALTAHALMGDRKRAFDAGFDEYESKPVEFSRLLDKINALSHQEATHEQQ